MSAKPSGWKSEDDGKISGPRKQSAYCMYTRTKFVYIYSTIQNCGIMKLLIQKFIGEGNVTVIHIFNRELIFRTYDTAKYAE